MRRVLSRRALALVISIAMLIALGATTSIAQQKMVVSGKMTQTYTKQEKMEVGDVPGCHR